MKKVMAVNSGSSSLKFQLLEMPEEQVISSGIVERIGLKDSVFTLKFNGEKHEMVKDIKDHNEAVNLLLEKLLEYKILASFDEIAGVGHRIVQGGTLPDSVLLGEKELAYVEELCDLAPLHNPAHLIGIRAFMELLPSVPNVGVFDTSFHQTMKEEAFLYATPYEWYTDHKVRKYGAHGTSHRYVSQRCAEIMGKNVEDTNIIVAHIGNGASLCAVKGGKSVDTSMGLTPLGGIPMGTRCGDLDPAIIGFMSEKLNKTAPELITMCNKQSGYLGVSGVSSDSRDLDKGVKEGNERCKLAIDVQAKRIVDFISSYYVYMGGADAIVFTAGIGENAPSTRKNVIDRLAVLGVKLDEEANNCRGVERLISAEDSKFKVYVIPTNEEIMIARDVVRLGNIL